MHFLHLELIGDLYALLIVRQINDPFIKIFGNIIGSFSKKKDLSMPFLLHQVEMELSRRSKIKHFAFSKCTGLTSLFNSFNKRCS